MINTILGCLVSVVSIFSWVGVQPKDKTNIKMHTPNLKVEVREPVFKTIDRVRECDKIK